MSTQEDIAKKLHISRTTVSRALQGTNVNDKTRKLVLEMASSMGYVQNVAAASLAAKNSREVYAFVVATVDEGYAMQMTQGIQEVAKIWNGYQFHINVMLTDINDGKNQDKTQLRQFQETIENNRVDGVIFSALSRENMEYVSVECRKRNIPLMTLDMIYRSDGLCHVGPDYYQLGTYSAAYLSQLMRKKGKILALSYDEGYEIGVERMRGFLEYLAQNTAIQVQNICIHEMSRQAYAAVLEEQLYTFGPDAVYAPYHVEYIAEYLELHGKANEAYILIANGVNENIEKYLFSGMINGIVSARPYYLGAVAANNFFKYFYRTNEMVKGDIDAQVDIYIAENYRRHELLF